MKINITIQQLNDAFNKAENETAEQYNKQTCSLKDKDGDETCPICFFRQRVRAHIDHLVEEVRY